MTTTWIQDPDRCTYRARRGDVTLIVKRLGLDKWVPEVHRPGVKPDSGPVDSNRGAAQRWAERKAGEKP